MRAGETLGTVASSAELDTKLLQNLTIRLLALQVSIRVQRVLALDLEMNSMSFTDAPPRRFMLIECPSKSKYFNGVGIALHDRYCSSKRV